MIVKEWEGGGELEKRKKGTQVESSRGTENDNSLNKKKNKKYKKQCKQSQNGTGQIGEHVAGTWRHIIEKKMAEI